ISLFIVVNTLNLLALLPYNGFFYWRLVVLFIKYEPINYITCFSIPVSNSIGTVKCIEVVYYA
ncbi:hypothetical protein, partial [Absiella sp. AM09-45]|uniref:hypothetical protein n=1 Tax=Absiella sp. AM09-45 TaxID=2291993 RepID=UPI001F45707C